MQLLYHIITKIRHYKIKNSLQKKGALLRASLSSAPISITSLA